MTEKPDKEAEEFWLGFKKSMYNFYKDKKIRRNISEWSETLNKLSDLMDYDNLESKIRDYISLYAIDIIRCRENRHFKIMITNIKRWNRISNKFKLNSINNEYYSIIYLIIDLYRSIINYDLDLECLYLFEDIELLLINKNFNKFIKFAIDNNKSGLLDKLGKYFQVKEIVKDIYDIESLPSKISNKKLIKLINDSVE